MGWPDGWVTDPVLRIKRSDQLRLIGNGVVPQQAYAAITYLLNVCAVTEYHDLALKTRLRDAVLDFEVGA